MLLFDEMNIHEKIKIYNKYAILPQNENLKILFFSKQAKFMREKIFLQKFQKMILY